MGIGIAERGSQHRAQALVVGGVVLARISAKMCRWLRCKKRAMTSMPTKPVTPVIRIGWYSDGGLDSAGTFI
jgi:hypothetical protein